MSEELDQTRAPILEAIEAYRKRHPAAFTTPGHKLGRGVDEYTASILGRSTFESDVPELNGTEDRHMRVEVTKEAQALAAKVHHADETFFSSNGSSLSAHSALMTVANRGDKVIFARNFHRSVGAAIVLSEVSPVWLQPPVDEGMNVQHGPITEQVRAMLDRHPDAKAVLITSPDYYGVAGHVQGIAAACHFHDIPLVVDGAWGPHFPFHPELPPTALECGADIEIGSIHKTLNGIQQASIFSYQGSLVDPDRAMLTFGLFESTSPTMLVFGSIDGNRRLMALRGEELWGRALAFSERIHEAVATIPGMTVLGPEVLQQPGAAGLDRTKVVIDFHGMGITGLEAADWLQEHCEVRVELADQRRIMALLTIGDDDQSVGRFIAGLHELAAWAERRQAPAEVVCVPPMQTLHTELVRSPRDSMFGPTRMVKLTEATGEISAQMMSPYPPGIPTIMPGERFTPPIVEFLQKIQQLEIPVPDATDSSLETVRVVA